MITRSFICLTTIAKQRITMHINLFFLNNHVGTPKGLLQEYLSSFRGNKVQKERVLLGGGGGGQEEAGDICCLWCLNFRQSRYNS